MSPLSNKNADKMNHIERMSMSPSTSVVVDDLYIPEGSYPIFDLACTLVSGCAPNRETLSPVLDCEDAYSAQFQMKV